ncbi:hypothetical protein U8C37_08965 [Sinorhizobium medicae]|nr:hypothetical protein [Sinorhizobium medicae]WQO87455.1 hypothetical protein U8C37_08965 [Sinorhizobium medicae]
MTVFLLHCSDAKAEHSWNFFSVNNASLAIALDVEVLYLAQIEDAE